MQGTQPIVFWEHLLMAIEDVKPLSPYERHVAERLAPYVRDRVTRQRARGRS